MQRQLVKDLLTIRRSALFIKWLDDMILPVKVSDIGLYLPKYRRYYTGDYLSKYKGHWQLSAKVPEILGSTGMSK